MSVNESGTRDVLLSILAKTKEECAEKCDRDSRCIAFDFTGNKCECECENGDECESGCECKCEHEDEDEG